ncbi:MAG: permease [Pseudonocardia sp.]|uniref:permease n=1 Tax=Pseudonocardia sp. TaxID=60912 RepID=UPI003D0AB581
MRALGERVRHSEHDAAAARVLAGGADRDVAEIRSEIREFRSQNNRVLNAMRADLADVRVDLTDVRADVRDLREHVDRGFASMRGALDATAAGQERIAGMLSRLVDEQERPAGE